MSTITRERAELKSFITGFLSDPAHDNQSSRSMTAEVFRIALASLEADPVSVPDEIDRWQASDDMRDHDESFRWDSADGYKAGWNAFRAAILQGAEPVSQRDELPAKVIDALEKALQAMSFMGDTLNALDAVCEEDVEYVTPAFEAVREVLEGNSPVIPDGWVACSERMPEERQEVIVMDTERGKVQSGIIYQRGRFVDFNEEHYEVKNPPYWMPLPSVPSQEIK